MTRIARDMPHQATPATSYTIRPKAVPGERLDTPQRPQTEEALNRIAGSELFRCPETSQPARPAHTDLRPWDRGVWRPRYQCRHGFGSRWLHRTLRLDENVESHQYHEDGEHVAFEQCAQGARGGPHIHEVKPDQPHL